jgi:hypothetical protein
MISYESSYMPGFKGFHSPLSFDRLTSERLENIQLRGRLISVDIEKRKIIKVTKTVEVNYDYKDLPVPVI